MTDPVADLTAHAQALPPEDRARLAQALLSSLNPQDATVDAAWDLALKQRIAEVDAQVRGGEPCAERGETVAVALQVGHPGQRGGPRLMQYRKSSH